MNEITHKTNYFSLKPKQNGRVWNYQRSQCHRMKNQRQCTINMFLLVRNMKWLTTKYSRTGYRKLHLQRHHSKPRKRFRIDTQLTLHWNNGKSFSITFTLTKLRIIMPEHSQPFYLFVIISLVFFFPPVCMAYLF